MIKPSSTSTEVSIHVADITNEDDVQRAMDAAIAHFGSVPDVLVNNAGGISGVGSLCDVDLEEFFRAFAINVKGPLIVLQAFLRANRAHSPDMARTVINISSGAAHTPYYPGGAAYSASKLATAKIVEYLYHENPTWSVFNMQPGKIDNPFALQHKTMLWLACLDAQETADPDRHRRRGN